MPGPLELGLGRQAYLLVRTLICLRKSLFRNRLPHGHNFWFYTDWPAYLSSGGHGPVGAAFSRSQARAKILADRTVLRRASA